MAEGLKSGCDLPLIGRSGVLGVLSALKRSERAFAKEDVEFLEQVSRQVAIAVENALDYETAIKDRDKETKTDDAIWRRKSAPNWEKSSGRARH